MKHCIGVAMLLVAITSAPVALADDPTLTSAVEARVGRAIDGSSLDVHVNGQRVAVAYLGARAPGPSQTCGQAALLRNRELAGRHVRLVEDPSAPVDATGRRLFYAYAADGTSIDAALIREGLAWAAHPDSPRGGELAALQAEAEADGRGCLWDGSTG